MIIMGLLVGWVAVALVFCLALARAASRPMPQPDMMDAAEPSFGYENAYEPAAARMQPSFGNRIAALS